MKVNKGIIFKLNLDKRLIVNLQKWSTWLDSNQRYSSAQVRRPRSDWPTGRHAISLDNIILFIKKYF